MNSKNTLYIIAVCFLVLIAVACTTVLVELSGTPIDLDSDILHTTITSMYASDTATLSETTTTETTMTETTTTKTTTTVTTTTTIEIPVIETEVNTTMAESSDQRDSCRMVYDDVYKVFTHGTYYCGSSETVGGSGRELIDCSVGDGIIKGSVASYFLYTELGYNLNGNRTVVYLEIPEFPKMNGIYYLDDCSTSENMTVGNITIDANETIDFFYTDASNCPFQNIGVITVKCYLINEDY